MVDEVFPAVLRRHEKIAVAKFRDGSRKRWRYHVERAHLQEAMAIIEAGRIRSPEHRVALYLSRLFWRSTRRLNLTQEELGQLAGLSRQTVNRVLQALEAAGIVTLDFGRVAIVDDEALNALLAATALV